MLIYNNTIAFFRRTHYYGEYLKYFRDINIAEIREIPFFTFNDFYIIF